MEYIWILFSSSVYIYLSSAECRSCFRRPGRIFILLFNLNWFPSPGCWRCISHSNRSTQSQIVVACLVHSFAHSLESILLHSLVVEVNHCGMELFPYQNNPCFAVYIDLILNDAFTDTAAFHHFYECAHPQFLTSLCFRRNNVFPRFDGLCSAGTCFPIGTNLLVADIVRSLPGLYIRFQAAGHSTTDTQGTWTNLQRRATDFGFFTSSVFGFGIEPVFGTVAMAAFRSENIKSSPFTFYLCHSKWEVPRPCSYLAGKMISAPWRSAKAPSTWRRNNPWKSCC